VIFTSAVPAAAQIVKREPALGGLKPGERVLVDDGSCGPGKIKEVIDGNHVFETVSSGGIVGEMALISNDTRTATVRAISKSVVVPVDEKRFLFLVQQTPFFAIRILRVMCDRLKVMNERVTLLSE